MQIVPIGRVYNFMAQRRLWGTFSFLFCAAAAVLCFAPGPRLGTDFKGGTEVELRFASDVSDEQVREAVQQAGFSNPDVIRVHEGGEKNRVLIRVQEVSAIDEEGRAAIERALCYGTNLDANTCPEATRASEVKLSPGGDKITVRYRSAPDLAQIKAAMSSSPGGVVLRDGENNPSLQNARENKVEILLKSKGDQLMDGLRATLGEVAPKEALRMEWIGPKAGAQLRDAAIQSTVIALVFILIYVGFRFDMRFAPGAVIALIHDALATFGVLILLDREITLTTVAALLTIIGFSVNDTVVIFDRVRENTAKLRGVGFIKIIDISLSEMLGRTLLTSFTAIMSLLAFFIWGTGSLKEFALTLVIGMTFGVYSSIYIALPLTHWLDRKFFHSEETMGVGGSKPKAVRPKKEAAVV
jgi:preprotein translocase subunit SecF